LPRPEASRRRRSRKRTTRKIRS